MREILFRGKRVDNGEWVYGYYWQTINNIHSQPRFYIREKSYSWDIKEYEVDYKTVGQYTGFDKNGKKMFEGDIVKWNEKEWGRPYNELVEFDYELLAMRKTDYEQWCEVIGNIHDNPELLGE